MSRTARAVFVDGEMIGYLPVTNAENVEYENTNVKTALDGLSSGKVDKSGDTMTGQLNIDFHDGTTLNDGFSVMSLGNSIPTGTAGNSQGIIDFYAPTGNIVRLYTADNITARRFVQLPDADGTLALKSDIFDSFNPFAFRGHMGYDIASTDFDTYTTGTYRNDGTNMFAYSHAPSSSPDNGWLICFTDSRFYYQFWISTYLGSCMWRKRSNGTWGSWTAWNF